MSMRLVGPMPASLELFFTTALAAWERAVVSPVDTTFLVAGRQFALRCADPTLAALISPALAHLIDPSAGPAELTIYAWAGRASPPPPWLATAPAQRGALAGYEAGNYLAAFDAEAGLLCAFDLARGVALYWLRDQARMPDHERSAPLRLIFHWWLRRHNCHLVHAGAVGSPTGGLLLVGRGGTGKSTSTMACIGSGLGFLADDYCLVVPRPTPHVFSLYSSARLNADSLAWLPQLAPLVANAARPTEAKACLYLHERRPADLLGACPLRAVLLPQVGTGPVGLRPVSSATALRALAPSTIFQLSGADGVTFSSLAELVGRLPCFTLQLGPDLRSVPVTLAALLDQLERES